MKGFPSGKLFYFKLFRLKGLTFAFIGGNMVLTASSKLSTAPAEWTRNNAG